MNKFFTRTRHLDKHTSALLRAKARAMKEGFKKDNKLYGYCKDIDSPIMRELASKFHKHEHTNDIYEWLCNQDSAFRDYVPVQVFDILKTNRER